MISDHVILKTGVMMLNILLFYHTNILHFKIDNRYLKLQYFTILLFFLQINAALV